MPYKDKTKQAAWYQQDKKNHPEKYRARTERQQKVFRRIRGFGAVKREIIEAIWLAQDKKCAICEIPIEFNAHVDHDHLTGLIRGMLCKNCNPGLGQFKDNIRSLERAIDYLRRYESR
jgi:hypothetical protein